MNEDGEADPRMWHCDCQQMRGTVPRMSLQKFKEMPPGGYKVVEAGAFAYGSVDADGSFSYGTFQ